jgi:hypothetical protein
MAHSARGAVAIDRALTFVARRLTGAGRIASSITSFVDNERSFGFRALEPTKSQAHTNTRTGKRKDLARLRADETFTKAGCEPE